MSSEPMKMLSRWVHVRWTSSQMEMTESATDSLLCHDDTSSMKWAMCLDDMRLCSWTWLSSSVSISSSSVRRRGTWVRWWVLYWSCIPGEGRHTLGQLLTRSKDWKTHFKCLPVPVHVELSSESTFSIPISFTALSTIPLTSSSKQCRLNCSRSARVVSCSRKNKLACHPHLTQASLYNRISLVTGVITGFSYTVRPPSPNTTPPLGNRLVLQW